VVGRRLELKVEAIFHPDSYGYRPVRAPQDAVEVCWRRCWKRDWVIDLDIPKFFDTVPWDLIIKAVQGKHRPAVSGADCQTVAPCTGAADRQHEADAGSGPRRQVTG
jgi:hypothetical protein